MNRKLLGPCLQWILLACVWLCAGPGWGQASGDLEERRRELNDTVANPPQGSHPVAWRLPHSGRAFIDGPADARNDDPAWDDVAALVVGERVLLPGLECRDVHTGELIWQTEVERTRADVLHVMDDRVLIAQGGRLRVLSLATGRQLVLLDLPVPPAPRGPHRLVDPALLRTGDSDVACFHLKVTEATLGKGRGIAVATLVGAVDLAAGKLLWHEAARARFRSDPSLRSRYRLDPESASGAPSTFIARPFTRGSHAFALDERGQLSRWEVHTGARERLALSPPGVELAPRDAADARLWIDDFVFRAGGESYQLDAEVALADPPAAGTELAAIRRGVRKCGLGMRWGNERRLWGDAILFDSTVGEWRNLSLQPEQFAALDPAGQRPLLLAGDDLYLWNDRADQLTCWSLSAERVRFVHRIERSTSEELIQITDDGSLLLVVLDDEVVALRTEVLAGSGQGLPLALRELGALELAAGEPAAAAAAYRRHVEMLPADWRGMFGLGQALAAAGEFEGLAWLDRTLEPRAGAPDEVAAAARALLRDVYGLIDRQVGSSIEWVFGDAPLETLAPERLWRDLNRKLESVRPGAVDRTHQLRPLFQVDHARRVALPLTGDELLLHDPREGRLICVAPDGRSRWARKLSPRWSQDGARLGWVFVAAQHADWLVLVIHGTSPQGAHVELVAVDRANGDERWSDQLMEPAGPRKHGQVWSCSVGRADIAVVVGGSREVRLYDAESGKRRGIAVRGGLRDLWSATDEYLLVRNEQPGSIASESCLIDVRTGVARPLELGGTSRPVLFAGDGSPLALQLHTQGRLALHDLGDPPAIVGEVILPWPSPSRRSPAPALLHLVGERLIVCPAAQDSRRFLFNWKELRGWMVAPAVAAIDEDAAAQAAAQAAAGAPAPAPATPPGAPPAGEAQPPAPTAEESPPLGREGDFTCALIRLPGFDDRQEALIDQIQERLGAMPDLRVLDRARVELSLAERTLSFALGRERQPAREVGELVQARVLVLLEPAPAGARVAFVETELGLRLGEGELRFEGSPAQLAIELALQIDRALVQRLGDVERVFAVVPLVCRDLDGDAREQGRELGRLVREALERQPGTEVVALGNAARISEERWLAAATPELRRPLPFFLVGTYRNHRQPTGDTVDISLRVRQRDRVLGSVDLVGVAVAELPARLEDAVARVALTATGRGGFADESRDDLEGALLSELAEAHRRRREWLEALQVEHVLQLLEGDAPGRRWQLVDTAGRLCEQHQATDGDSHVGCAEVLELLARTLEVLGSIDEPSPSPASRLAGLAWRRLDCHAQAPEAYRNVIELQLAVMTDLMCDPRIPPRELIDPAYRILASFRSLGDQPWLDALDEILLALDAREDAFREQCILGCATWPVRSTSPEALADLHERLRQRLSQRLRDLPRVHDLAWSTTDQNREENAATLAEIAGAHGDYDPGWWRRVGDPLERFAPPRPPRIRPVAGEALPDSFVTTDDGFQLSRVVMRAADGVTLREMRRPGTWLPATGDFELLVDNGGVYRIDRELGLTPLLEVPERSKTEICAHAVWDGRHVWVSLAGAEGGVRVISRDGGRVLARLDLPGLRQGVHSTRLVPVREGEALLLATNNRGCRILRLTLAGGAVRSETIYEAHSMPESLEGIVPRQPLLFMPIRVQILRHPGQPAPRLLIAYGGWSPYRVLAVDLADGGLQLLEYPGEDSSLVGWDDEQLYLTRKLYDAHRQEHRLHLMSAPIAGGEPTLLVDLGRGEHGDGPTTRHGEDGVIVGRTLYFPIEIGERDQKGTPLQPHLVSLDLDESSEPTLADALATGRLRVTPLPQAFLRSTLSYSEMHGLLLRTREGYWRVEELPW